MIRLGDTPFVIVAVTLSCLSFALGAKCGMAHYKRHVAKKRRIAREEYASVMSRWSLIMLSLLLGGPFEKRKIGYGDMAQSREEQWDYADEFAVQGVAQGA